MRPARAQMLRDCHLRSERCNRPRARRTQSRGGSGARAQSEAEARAARDGHCGRAECARQAAQAAREGQEHRRRGGRRVESRLETQRARVPDVEEQ